MPYAHFRSHEVQQDLAGAAANETAARQLLFYWHDLAGRHTVSRTWVSEEC